MHIYNNINIQLWECETSFYNNYYKVEKTECPYLYTILV